MTGYGIDSFHVEDTTITVEIRSVNSRYLDFIPKIPRSLHELESEMKKIMQNYFQRGRIELYITITGSQLENRSLFVDWVLMDEFIEQIKVMKDRYQLAGDIPLSVITTMEELVTIKEEKRRDDSLYSSILRSVERAAKQVQASRKSEGVFLMKDIEQRIDELNEMIQLIAERKEIVYENYHQRIKERIEIHIGEALQIDQTQLLHEIALMAEKGDVTEEITRLFSHLTHFKQIITTNEPMGRKLDFITQEMHREMNTIGAKSVDPLISEMVVKVKSNLEKIKEQVQNIE